MSCCIGSKAIRIRIGCNWVDGSRLKISGFASSSLANLTMFHADASGLLLDGVAALALMELCQCKYLQILPPPKRM